MDILIVSFLILMPFISFPCLILDVSIPNTTLNKAGESGYPYLVPDFRGKMLSAFPIQYDTGCWFVIYWLPLSFWSKFLLYLIFWGLFIMKRCSILSDSFFASVQVIKWFLFFVLTWFRAFNDLEMLHDCVSEKSCVTIMYDLFAVVLYFVC